MANPVHLLQPAGDWQAEGHVTAKQNLRLYSDTAFLGTLDHAITAARTWTLPNATGTLALTSDVVTDHGGLTGLGDDDHTQYRLESENHTHQSSGAQAGQLDHGLAITGLTDDDHTQYALLAGRSGGQTLIGGTAVGDFLALQSTSGNGSGEYIKFLGGNNGATEIARMLRSTSGHPSFVVGRATISLDGAVMQHHAPADQIPYFFLSGASLAHGMTDNIPTDVGAMINFATASEGGMNFQGFRSDAAFGALNFTGNVGAAPTSSGAITFTSRKKSGTGVTAIADTDIGWDFLAADTVKARIFGGGAIALKQQADPTPPTNMAGIYAKDVGGTAELFGFDEAGNFPQLTPHPTPFLNMLPLTDRPYPWAYYSVNPYLGKSIKVDMAGLLSMLVFRAGASLGDFVLVEELPMEQRRDWDTDQEANNQRRIEEQQAWDASPSEKPRPANYIKKAPPYWLRIRGVQSAL